MSDTYVGNCCVCSVSVDDLDVGYCEYCDNPFHYEKCGGVYKDDPKCLAPGEFSLGEHTLCHTCGVGAGYIKQ